MLSNVILTDVFGKTLAVNKLAKQLNSVAIIDPYLGEMMNFTDEKAAYQHFVDHVGLDSYFEIANEQIKQLASVNTFIGFSVGASTLWRLTEEAFEPRQNAICYYGSQIRNFDQLKPQVSTTLVFPRSEPHFDVSLLHDKLAKQVNINATKTPYLHGFMNENSTNYNEQGYQQQLQWLHSLR